jgi:hypothetical protein
MSTSNSPERYFQHFKGGLYQYIAEAKDSETLETVIVYRALYGDGGLWTRLATSFFSTVVRNGETIPRFRELTKEEYLQLQQKSVC